MKTYCIVVHNNEMSETGYKNLVSGSKSVGNDFEIEKFYAVVPETVDLVMKEHSLIWNYPWDKNEYDESLNLVKHPYSCKNPKKKMACALSHFLLWHRCMTENQPILILEHDALFVHKLNYESILQSKYDVIGINDPRKATRKANFFHSCVQKNVQQIQDVPWIDDKKVPQGLAGASAYVIKPKAAKEILYTIYTKTGLWHNDALLCKQIFPNMGVTRTYYTKIQNLPSTTTSK